MKAILEFDLDEVEIGGDRDQHALMIGAQELAAAVFDIDSARRAAYKNDWTVDKLIDSLADIIGRVDHVMEHYR